MVELSQRERQIVCGVVEGMTYREIAEGLGLTYETIKTYAKRLRKKLGVNSRTAIAIWGMKNGRRLHAGYGTRKDAG